jgi:hypothetical protein
MAVDKEIAEHVRGIAKELNMTAQDVINQLLRFALDQNEVQFEVKMVKLTPKTVRKQPPRGSKK